MSYIKNYFWDEINEREDNHCEPDFCHEEYDIIEPALTNEPMTNDLPF